MGLHVLKFGGTSVGTPERISAVADRIARRRARGDSLVVVVSAMGHTTDELIDLAHRVSARPSHREMDMLLSAGERISMALLGIALVDRKVDAVSFTGSQTGIITDASHRRARIKRILGDRVRDAVGIGRVAIVAGFQGVSESKEITTLGRGGSDTTAVALAATLGAERCEIYTDVDGVYSADPRIVPGARLWSRIPHEHMVELATRGAGVLHPRSVELAARFGVRLTVLNSMNENEGTQVVTLKEAAAQAGIEEFQVVGVTGDRGRALLTVELARPSVLTALWDRAEQAHLSVVAPSFQGARVAFFIERDGFGEWRKLLSELGAAGFVTKHQIHEDQVPVSIVGNRFSQDGGALGAIFDTLASNRIEAGTGVASALAATVSVPEKDMDAAVRALHDRWVGKAGGIKG